MGSNGTATYAPVNTNSGAYSAQQAAAYNNYGARYNNYQPAPGGYGQWPGQQGQAVGPVGAASNCPAKHQAADLPWAGQFARASQPGEPVMGQCGDGVRTGY